MHIVDYRQESTIDGFLNVTLESLLTNEDINTIFGVFQQAMITGVTGSEQLGRDVQVYGIDGDEPSLRMVAEGRIAGIHVQWPRVNASLCLFALLRVINGDDFERELWEPDAYALGFATAENYEVFLKGIS